MSTRSTIKNDAKLACAQALMSQGVLRPDPDVCDFLQVGRSTVFGLMRSGELATVRIGGDRRIPVQSVIDYLARRLVVEHDEAELFPRCKVCSLPWSGGQHNWQHTECAAAGPKVAA